jgi:hypothetical protein
MEATIAHIHTPAAVVVAANFRRHQCRLRHLHVDSYSAYLAMFCLERLNGDEAVEKRKKKKRKTRLGAFSVEAKRKVLFANANWKWPTFSYCNCE